jgi:hypothetical protein
MSRAATMASRRNKHKRREKRKRRSRAPNSGKLTARVETTNQAPDHGSDGSRSQRRAQQRYVEPLLLVLTGVAVLLAAAVAVTTPRALSLISAVLGLLGVGGLFSPRTPIGQWLYSNRWPSNAAIERFFIWYRRSLVKTLQLLAIVGIYCLLSFFDFMVTHMIVLMTSLIISGITLFSLFQRDGIWWGGVAYTFVTIVMILGLSRVSEQVVESGTLDHRYETLRDRMVHHGRKPLTDPMVLQAPQLRDYRVLYLTYYRMRITSSQLLLQYQWYRQPFELWDGKLPSPVDSKQAAFEHRFKSRWAEFAEALKTDPELIQFTRESINASKSKAESRRAWLSPELQPEYLALSIVGASLEAFTSFSVVSSVLIASTLFTAFDQRRVIVLLTLLIVTTLLCYSASRWIDQYNRRNDPDFNGPHSLFFVCLAVASFVVSWWTF